MAKLVDTITEPAAKSAILWVLGEYNERVPKIAPDVLRKWPKHSQMKIHKYVEQIWHYFNIGSLKHIIIIRKYYTNAMLIILPRTIFFPGETANFKFSSQIVLEQPKTNQAFNSICFQFGQI